MKKISIFLLVGIAVIYGCHKADSSISTSQTTYVVSPVPATDAHNVLIEEFSGQSCSNCPYGNILLDTLLNSHPGRINIITYYEADGSEVTDTPRGAAYDFTSTVALAIGNSQIYNSVPVLPSAGIDRKALAGGNLLTDGVWDSLAPTYLPVTDSLNLAITSTCNASAGIGAMTVTVTYTKEMATQQKLSVMIVEDSIVDCTLYPFGVVNTGYVYNNVFRYMVTAVPYGDTMLTTMAVKEPGRVMQRKYVYTLPTTSPATKVAHCRAVAFVSEGGIGNYQVLQSVQTPLNP